MYTTFLWGKLKSNVYIDLHLQNLQDIKTRIKLEIRIKTLDMIKNV